MDGFTGKACERNLCEASCNARGVCTSMRKFASETYDDNSKQFSYESVWDAEKFFGCVCDEGYTGYDCSVQTCPEGDDPLTTGQVNEVQLIKCKAASGSFTLLYKGYASRNIAYNAAASTIEAALESIPDILDVDVSFTDSSSGACYTSSVQIVQVTFLQNFGSLPPLVPKIGSLGEGASVSVSADGKTKFTDKSGSSHVSVKGTKESEACSNRGFCDTTQGYCTCYNTNGDAYESSDGYGSAGTRGDCGYTLTTIANCPGDVACSGHGVCTTSDGSYLCSCSKGYTSGDCSIRECPKGRSWFSYPSSSEKAHDALVECSDGGVCDVTTGECVCGTLFTGAACDKMACPGGSTTPCNNQGKCLTMAELAQVAEDNGDATSYTYGADPNNAHTWDAHRVMGCHCDEGYTGYDCSERVCPSGDDPATYDDEKEVQVLSCVASSGSFTLTFRQQETADIAYNSTAAQLKSSLEALTTIGTVSVSFSNATTLCASSVFSSNPVSVTFENTPGDLPALTASTTSLLDITSDSGKGTVDIATDGSTIGTLTSVTGTTENVYCSNHGLCERSTGLCTCFSGWGASDGQGNQGERRDCGHRKKA